MELGALCERLEIKQTELDEPVVKGSTVRHDGRLGTVVETTTGGGGETYIIIGWADDGRTSRWIEAWEKNNELFARADSANLDRKQVMISALTAMENTARTGV